MFLPHKTAAGNVIPWEYLPSAAITPKAGMAMVQSSGNLKAAVGTDRSTYICMAERSDAVTAGEIIPAIWVDETTNSAAFTSVKLGDKVKLHASDGLQVTATTGGPTEVVWFDDAAKAGAGGVVHVRFPAPADAASGT